MAARNTEQTNKYTKNNTMRVLLAGPKLLLVLFSPECPLDWDRKKFVK